MENPSGECVADNGCVKRIAHFVPKEVKPNHLCPEYVSLTGFIRRNLWAIHLFTLRGPCSAQGASPGGVTSNGFSPQRSLDHHIVDTGRGFFQTRRKSRSSRLILRTHGNPEEYGIATGGKRSLRLSVHYVGIVRSTKRPQH